MSGSLTEYVNLRELARKGAEIDVEAPLSAFGRVAALAVTGPQASESVIRLHLGMSLLQDAALLTGELEGSVILTCQRCMDAMDYSLAGPMLLAVSEEDEEVEGLPEGCELVSLLDADELGPSLNEVCLLPLVEDELLLRIPLVPMHGEGIRCEGRDRIGDTLVAAETREEITRPFSALADLMANKGKGH
jgi:uncharacterized protein